MTRRTRSTLIASVRGSFSRFSSSLAARAALRRRLASMAFFPGTRILDLFSFASAAGVVENERHGRLWEWVV